MCFETKWIQLFQNNLIIHNQEHAMSCLKKVLSCFAILAFASPAFPCPRIHIGEIRNRTSGEMELGVCELTRIEVLEVTETTVEVECIYRCSRIE